MSKLFRQHAVDSWERRLEGELLITRSLGLTITTLLITIVSTSLIIWALLGTYARVEPVSGQIVASTAIAKIYAERPGHIVWAGVREGDLVRADQPLLRVETEQALIDGRSPTQAKLLGLNEEQGLLESQIGDEQRSYHADTMRLRSELSALSAERRSLVAEVEAQRQYAASTKEDLETFKTLSARGYVARTDLQKRLQIWLNASSQYQAATSQIASLDGKRTEVEGELEGLPSKHASRTSDLIRSRQDLSQKRIEAEYNRGFTLKSPIAGRVTAMQTAVGRSTDGKIPLLTIVPQEARVEALLFAPSRAVGTVEVGQTVRLKYDAFPYERFGSFSGRITRISRSVLAPSEVDTSIKIDEPVYEIAAVLDRPYVVAFGQRYWLAPGMTLKANIILDRRSFLHWLLRPIEAVKEAPSDK